MTEKKTRKPTAGERILARLNGQPEPEEIEVETRSTAELHLARLSEPRESVKPEGMSTAEWYERRIRGEDAPPAA